MATFHAGFRLNIPTVRRLPVVFWLRHLVQFNVIFECRNYLSYISHQAAIDREVPVRERLFQMLYSLGDETQCFGNCLIYLT